MKKLSILLLSICVITTAAMSQHAFIPEFQFGSFDKIDLINAEITNIGTTQSKLGASDFGPGGVLFAIDEWYNGFYQVDTTDGSVILLGTNPPPDGHTWTGMAYDEAEGIMYACSYHDVYEEYYSSIYTIDVSDGSYTFIGTQSTAPAIACIAIDGIGEMYAMQLGDPAKLYKLDKTTGLVISFQGDIGHWAAGEGHGMDWCPENETMYLATATQLSTENTLRTIDLSNANTTIVGNLGIADWIGSIAVAPVLEADFSADPTEVCIGGTVSFTDESSWATSWSWTFEGGTPATSIDQNPSVVYNSTGIFGVSLEVSNGATTNTLNLSDMITVKDAPVQPSTPEGPVNTCYYGMFTYSTTSVPWADTYLWEVLPADAGSMSGTGISAIFDPSNDWSGDYTIKVMASNNCGDSDWSSELSCTLSLAPYPFSVEEGGSYCEGEQGIEVILDGSETDMDYELFLDDISTGTIISGTGNPLNFGYQTDDGTYTVIGYSTDCSTLMYGAALIDILYLPAEGSQPTGDVEVCSNTTTDYQTAQIPDADILIWVLNPSNAGIIIGSSENISIEWSASYNGTVYLSVFGSNDCGDGEPSDELEINVFQLPQPEVIGETLVCKDHENIYSTTDNLGSTYNWEVVGGNIVSGAGTSEIIVLWTTVGEGTILVTETAEVCETTSETLIVTIDDCTEIELQTIEDFNVYPNPANDQLTITFSSNNKMSYELSIYNQHGQKVYKAESNHFKGNGIYQINVSSFPVGLYILRMTTSTQEVHQLKFKVVK